jgi:hypothetical protein
MGKCRDRGGSDPCKDGAAADMIEITRKTILFESDAGGRRQNAALGVRRIAETSRRAGICDRARFGVLVASVP